MIEPDLKRFKLNLENSYKWCVWNYQNINVPTNPHLFRLKPPYNPNLCISIYVTDL